MGIWTFYRDLVYGLCTYFGLCGIFYVAYLIITYHPNMSFSFEQVKNGKLPFLDVEVSRQQDKFVTTVYRKSTLSGVYTHFDSFLTTVIIYTLVYRCFKIYFDWTKFHE